MKCDCCGEPAAPGKTRCRRHATAGLDEADEPTQKRASRLGDERAVEPTELRAPSSHRAAPRSVGPRASLHDGSEQQGFEPTLMRDPLIGAQLGDYVVRRSIGAGGMGIVYEGWQPLIERKVAIKVLRPEFATNPAVVSGLLSEARAANAIRHRGIIDIFGFGSREGVGQYIVMEYLEGSPLDEKLQDGALGPRETIRILDEVLAALQAAHARGVIHRDLKPSNVFLVTDPGGGPPYVKVLDFGLSKRAETPHGSSPQTRASVIVGTPEYMAPEQALAKPVSPATDLYALGILAYEMLTGQLPFGEGTVVEIAMRQVNDPPPSPRLLQPSLPASFEALILQLLEKRPEARPASAELVRARLRAIEKELTEGPALKPVSATVRLPSARVRAAQGAPARRRFGRTAILACAAVVAAGLGAAGVLLLARTPTNPAPVEAPAPVAVTAPAAVAAPVEPAPPTEPAEPAQSAEPTQPTEPTQRPEPTQPTEATEPSPPPSAPVAAQPERLPPARRPARPIPARDTGAAEPAATEPGVLKVLLESGWADVRVDGVLHGRAPTMQIVTLPAGPHVLELENPYRAPYRVEITIASGRTLEHRVRLQPPPGR